MKLAKLWVVVSALALSLSLMPSASWSSRALAPAVTGTVTAAPSSGTIEVDHRSYHVKPNSAATLSPGRVRAKFAAKNAARKTPIITNPC